MTCEDFKNHVQRISPYIRDIAGMTKSFEKEIASTRRSSLIQSFDELVMLLVRRLVVDPDDESTWANLNEVCIKYGGKPFYTPKPVGNQGAPTLQQQALLSHHEGHAAIDYNYHFIPSVPHGSYLLDPNGPIVCYLSRRILSSWRNFARGLKVPQGNIDKIENDFGSNNYEACVRAVLEDYKRNIAWASPNNGDVIKDIYSSLKLLQKEYLLEEFQRLTKQYA